ncbi:toxin-antitoxin system HicB family antitoxin [Marinihelvus fidelis]|uniref:Toxin-antitoxin system HicB family antitoxin n=1 Tax=Marinihelvus fidelis TaxID=2613842 RepID=A0A5N0T9A5_9GAMM|nr:toxin-antitoxin system HicB family antitoxin [Marinihelvus fidelis]KAA9131522.1 toxin-antitoxin system HicB family antitoxin [Marinihelvus fidelis]
MNNSDDYIRIVEWSDEDQCYIGRSPGLFLGGVHGDDEHQVYRDLVNAIKETVASELAEGHTLPAPTAGRQYSGKFNLRVGPELHELLSLRAAGVSESLNSYVVNSLERVVQDN